jgi:hypothetical protein
LLPNVSRNFLFDYILDAPSPVLADFSRFKGEKRVLYLAGKLSLLQIVAIEIMKIARMLLL